VRKEGSTPQVLAYGAISLDPKAPLVERLGTLVERLEPLVAEHAPTRLCMEECFFAKNARSALVLGHVRGAVMVLAHRHGMEFVERTPRSVKLSVSGTGAASKEQVAQMVQFIFGLSSLEGPLDASDALAVAWAGL
jgi:crossover junction endodeoxyribonuclease RuvC